VGIRLAFALLRGTNSAFIFIIAWAFSGEVVFSSESPVEFVGSQRAELSAGRRAET
jgi:hypothetical protein